MFAGQPPPPDEPACNGPIATLLMDDGRFEGWVEEVDSGTVLRFRSAEELLKFLGQRFDLSVASTEKARAGDSVQTPDGRKTLRKGRKST